MTKSTISLRLIAVFFVFLFAYLFLLGRIGMPLAHDSFDPLVMRDTCLLLSALIDRGVSFKDLVVEAMKHLEGPTQFVLMNLYCLGIQDAFPLTPATMQFPNTVLGIMAAAFAFLLIRIMFGTRMACLTAIALVLTPWFAAVVRLTQYFNMLALLLHFSTTYFLARLMIEPKSRLYRILVPLLLAVYLFSSLDWPSYFLFVALFCILSGNVVAMLRNRYNILIVMAFLVLLTWDVLLYIKFGTQGLEHTRFLYSFTVSFQGASMNSLKAIWNNEILGWGPLMVIAFGGLVFYVLKGRRRLSSDRITVGLLDACGLWLIWATIIVFWAAGHRTYLFVLGMPAAIFSGLLFSRIPIKSAVAIIVALGAFQIGLVTDWSFGLKTDERRRVLAAACYLIDSRPDLLAPDKTLLAVDSRRAGEKGLGGAVAQYARPHRMPIIIADLFPVSGIAGRGVGPGGKKELSDIKEAYERTGLLKADGVVLESEAVSEKNPASGFWLRLMKDPNIRWLATFKEEGGEIYLGEVTASNGTSVADAPLMDVQSLSDKYLEKYDRLSFLKKNIEYARLYFTSTLSNRSQSPPPVPSHEKHD